MNRCIARRGLAAALAPLPLLLGACSADEPSAAATRTTTPPATASTIPRSSTTSPTTTRTPSGFTPIPTEGSGLVPAGKVGMTANGRPDAPWAVVVIPTRNFSTIGGWVVFDEDPRGGGGVSYWTIDRVHADPCDQSETSPVLIPAGDTVESLVAAFRKQRRSRVGDPVTVTIDGHRGLRIDVRSPDVLDEATCPTYRMWEWTTAGVRHLESPGTEQLYILDVDGKVLVLTVSEAADRPKPAMKRLQRMVETARFVPRT